MYMKARLEIEVLNHDSRYIYDSHGGMISKQMATTGLAPDAIADDFLDVRKWISRVPTQLVFPPGDGDIFGFP